MAELITGEIEDFEAAIVVFFVEVFEAFVLRGKTAASSGIDNKEDFAFEIAHGDFFVLGVFNFKIINCTHIKLLFLIIA